MKYIPDGFLNEDQIAAKRRAIAGDELKGKTSKTTMDSKCYAIDIDEAIEGTRAVASVRTPIKATPLT